MALNIKDAETERLAAEVAALAGESKTRAVKVALQERRARLALRGGARDRRADFVRFLEMEVWPQVPRTALGRRPTRRERERILGFGSQGV
ncbi:MAG: protein transcription factor [Chloroflexi bacterium]|nr:MAG: protein transcription factor [Chloroflexota bacterium]